MAFLKVVEREDKIICGSLGLEWRAVSAMFVITTAPHEGVRIHTP